MLLYLWSKLFKKFRGSAIINCRIDKNSSVEAGSHIVNSTFGRYSYCGYDCELINCDIGSFCSIGNNVVVGGSNHPMDWVSMSPVFYAGRDSIKKKFSNHERKKDKRTSIGNDVWIGEKVIIKQGVSIGNGVVIGMGSVVTKDILPYSIIGGCPTKLIRMRFDEQTIEKLEEIKWWELSDNELTKFATYITEPEKFISEVRKK